MNKYVFPAVFRKEERGYYIIFLILMLVLHKEMTYRMVWIWQKTSCT